MVSRFDKKQIIKFVNDSTTNTILQETYFAPRRYNNCFQNKLYITLKQNFSKKRITNN